MTTTAAVASSSSSSSAAASVTEQLIGLEAAHGAHNHAPLLVVYNVNASKSISPSQDSRDFLHPVFPVFFTTPRTHAAPTPPLSISRRVAK